MWEVLAGGSSGWECLFFMGQAAYTVWWCYGCQAGRGPGTQPKVCSAGSVCAGSNCMPVTGTGKNSTLSQQSNGTRRVGGVHGRRGEGLKCVQRTNRQAEYRAACAGTLASRKNAGTFSRSRRPLVPVGWRNHAAWRMPGVWGKGKQVALEILLWYVAAGKVW